MDVPLKERRSSTTSSLKMSNFELQIEIRKKSSRTLSDKNASVIVVNDRCEENVNVVEKVEKLDLDAYESLKAPVNNNAVSVDVASSKINNDAMPVQEAKLHKEPTELIMDSFDLKKRTYFDKHNISNEYDKITNYNDSDSLFEIKTKQTLIKTFKFNANSKANIKKMKFKYSSEIACQNNSYLQQAKMAFYDTLLNKGGNNLHNKYLKALNSARFTSKSISKFDSEASNTLNNFYTNTTDNLLNPIETHRNNNINNNNKLPGLKGYYSEKINNQNHKSRNKPKDNLVVTNKPSENSTEDFTHRNEASEYYNNKIRLIAKLIDKHNAKSEEEKRMKKTYERLPSATSKKSKKNTNLVEDNQSIINSHFIASFPSQPGSNNNVHVLNGLNPFKTTKLDRQFKRVIHIDHNKRFNSKSSSQMGENNSQVNSEKPIDSSRHLNILKDHSFVKLSGILNKHQHQQTGQSKNSSNLVKIKFPSISNNLAGANNNDFENDEKETNNNIFASSSFVNVKSESAFKDTIKS